MFDFELIPEDTAIQKRNFFFIALLSSVLLAFSAFALYAYYSLPRQALEFILNYGTKDACHGSIRVEKARLDFKMKLRAEHIRGQFLSDIGFIPFEIDSVESRNSLFQMIQKDGLSMEFRGVRLLHSKRMGTDGTFTFKAGKGQFFRLNALMKEMDLSELEWLDPDNLKGSKGLFSGELDFQVAEGTNPHLSISSRAKEGGRLQGRFFDLLLPYLPVDAEKQIKMIVAQGGLVGFREGTLQLDTVRSDELKILLHIVVPDYNLNLNLNIKVRLDEENAFFQLAQVMGLVKIRTRQ